MRSEAARNNVWVGIGNIIDEVTLSANGRGKAGQNKIITAPRFSGPKSAGRRT